MSKFDKESFNKHEVWRLLQNNAGSWYQEADEFDRELLRNWMYDTLTDNQVQVDFVKADGTFRSMTCTLNEGLGAKRVNKLSTEKPELSDKKEICVVWDCNANGWRSFRWDRLRKISFTIG
jgi:hypothetical protein